MNTVYDYAVDRTVDEQQKFSAMMSHVHEFTTQQQNVIIPSLTLNNTRTNNAHVGQTLWIIFGPVIFVIGVTGNILIICVMSCRRMRKTTTCIYLRLMAIADLSVVLTGVSAEWFEAMGILTFKYIHPVTCKIEKFIFYTFADTAVWILVVFTVDRFIAVVFPLQKRRLCGPYRAQLYCIIALLAAVAKNFHVFWTRGAEYATIIVSRNNGTSNYSLVRLVSNCGRPNDAYRDFETYIRPWIAFALVSALPFVVIAVCNVFIIQALMDVKNIRSRQASTSRSTIGGASNSTIVSKADRTLVQMTAMCLSASFCFLVCITPSIVLLIGKPYWAGTPSKPNNAYEVAKAANNILVYVNHSLNFFLYSLTGKRFRTELVALVTCKRKRAAVAAAAAAQRRGSSDQLAKKGARRGSQSSESDERLTPRAARQANSHKKSQPLYRPTMGQRHQRLNKRLLEDQYDAGDIYNVRAIYRLGSRATNIGVAVNAGLVQHGNYNHRARMQNLNESEL